MALYLSDNPDSVRHYLSGNPDHVRHYVSGIPGSARYYASGNSLERRLECVLTPEAARYDDDDDDDREHDRGPRVEQEEATPTSVESHQTAVDSGTDEAVGYVDTYF